MQTSAKLPVLWGNAPTYRDPASGEEMSDFDACPIREMIFYEVENVSPFYYEGKVGIERQWSMLSSGGRDYIIAENYETVHQTIQRGRI